MVPMAHNLGRIALHINMVPYSSSMKVMSVGTGIRGVLDAHTFGGLRPRIRYLSPKT